MYTDAKHLVEPWNNNLSLSSNDRALHHLSSSSTTMYSPTKRCFDNDHVYDSTGSTNFPELCTDKATSFRVNRMQAFQNDTYSCDDYPKNLYPISSLAQEKGYYYETHKSEPKTYKYQESKASMHSHSKVTAKVLCDPFLDHSNFGTTHDVPGVVESESSSLDYSFDYSDSYVSNNSKYKTNHKEEIMSQRYNGYCREYPDDYKQFPSSQCDQKTSISNGTKIGAIASYEPNYKEVTGGTKCKMIEVAPGEFMRLRGAHETWKAIQNDFYLPCACFCCDLTLFCIQDATYVLCPECQVVNPLEKIDGYDGGVGLGFTMEELAEWQNDIVMNRRF